jgi:hypothetical protein
MNSAESIANAESRLAHAQSNINQIAHLGPSEKYLEWFFLVDALELQLERLRQERRLRAD